MSNSYCKNCGFSWEALDIYEECPVCSSHQIIQDQSDIYQEPEYDNDIEEDSDDN